MIYRILVFILLSCIVCLSAAPPALIRNAWTTSSVPTPVTVNLTSNVVISSGSTQFEIRSDPVRVPTVPVATIQPTTDRNAVILDMMPRDASGLNPAHSTNDLGTGQAWIDLLNRDLHSAPDPNNWNVLRMYIQTNTCGIGSATGGTNSQQTLNLFGAQLSFNTGTFPGTARGALNSTAWFFGNNGVNVATIQTSAGKAGFGTVSPQAMLHVTNSAAGVDLLTVTTNGSSVPVFNVSSNGNVTIANGVILNSGAYYKTNSLSVSAIISGFTNGDCWVGMLSNSLQAVCMSNNAVTFKILAP